MKDISMLFNILTVVFLVTWGAYERISAIRKEKKSSSSENRDRKSLIIFYATIFLGYGVGIPAAFTGYGAIGLFFPWISLAGFIIVALGLTIRLVAIRTLAEQFTYTVKIIENHRLITTGIYSSIRHPSYLGQSLIFLGCGMAFANWASMTFLFLPNFIAALYRISVEEKVLIEHFPERYRDYIAKTKLLIPGIY